jgi:hypothetical protein
LRLVCDIVPSPLPEWNLAPRNFVEQITPKLRKSDIQSDFLSSSENRIMIPSRETASREVERSDLWTEGIGGQIPQQLVPRVLFVLLNL